MRRGRSVAARGLGGARSAGGTGYDDRNALGARVVASQKRAHGAHVNAPPNGHDRCVLAHLHNAGRELALVLAVTLHMWWHATPASPKVTVRYTHAKLFYRRRNNYVWGSSRLHFNNPGLMWTRRMRAGLTTQTTTTE